VKAMLITAVQSTHRKTAKYTFTKTMNKTYSITFSITLLFIWKMCIHKKNVESNKSTTNLVLFQSILKVNKMFC